MKLGILPCQGACNVGNMTNKVTMKFVDNQKVNMVCPLGLPLGIQTIIDMAFVNNKFIALNGCPMKCSSKALSQIGIDDYEDITLTSDFGIEKNKNFQDETKMDQVEEKVRKVVEEYFANEKE